MTSMRITTASREEYPELRIKTQRWNASSADDIQLLSNNETNDLRKIRRKKSNKKKLYNKQKYTETELFQSDNRIIFQTDIGDKSRGVGNPNDDLSLDFSWLTKDSRLNCINDAITCDVSTESCHNDGNQCLSQRSALVPSSKPLKYEFDLQYERGCIEEEIRQKYAELNAILKQINHRRQVQKRRRKTHVKKADVTEESLNDQITPPIVNICPIRRRKRSAQPIRNALLVRTAMRKAWKGMLGSCCGKGCWATWKWVNMRGVMSDYE